MRYESWMSRDERSKKQIADDRARYADALTRMVSLKRLQDEESRLMAELEKVQAQLANIPATPAGNP